MKNHQNHINVTEGQHPLKVSCLLDCLQALVLNIKIKKNANKIE